MLKTATGCQLQHDLLPRPLFLLKTDCITTNGRPAWVALRARAQTRGLTPPAGGSPFSAASAAPAKGAALARHKPLPPKTTDAVSPKRAKTTLRFGSPRSGLQLATPRSPRGKGAAAAAPQNQSRRKGTHHAHPHRLFFALTPIGPNVPSRPERPGRRSPRPERSVTSTTETFCFRNRRRAADQRDRDLHVRARRACCLAR